MKISKTVFITLILLLIFKISYSQKYHSSSKSAIKLFEQAISSNTNDDAIKKLEKAVKIDPNFYEVYFLLAEIYEQQRNYELAIKNYEKYLSLYKDFDDMATLKLAINSYYFGNYNEAKEYLDLFLENANPKKPVSFDVAWIKENIYFAAEAFNNPVDFVPINLGKGVNTDTHEYWPSLSVDEETLVFTRLVPRDPSYSELPKNFEYFHEDLYVSHKDPQTGEYMLAIPMNGVINTPLNEGAQCISADGRICIITACERPDGKGSCDLYIMFNRGGRWTEPENMITINTKTWESNPSLSADGRTLYFASARPDGFGGIDIWKVEIDEKGRAVGEVENLGKEINTPFDDVSPFIHPDGKTLYFASNGHPGMGGLDLFFSKLNENGKWSKPQNLGYPINTKGEERSLIVNGKGNLAMFASNIENGNLDIYKFDLPEQAKPTTVTYVKGYVYDPKTEKRLQAECKLLDLETGMIVIELISDESSGEYMVSLPVDKDYAFNVSKDGYLFYSENFSLTNLKDPEKPYIINIPLNKIEEGYSVVLKNIFFNFESYELLPESYTELNKLIDYIKNNSGIKIEIGGHTDNTGSKEYNQTLSENRAKAVVDYLIKNGISDTDLSYKGYDYSVPIADNSTEEGRALNRRTEFKIVGYKNF